MADLATLRFETWDVFTQALYAGNQLAVVWEANVLSDAQMQRIAREFNYSETVFICKPSEGDCIASLRIFTPTFEIPFAGHPTIGAALALDRHGVVQADRCVLEERAGRVAIAFNTVDGARQAWLSPPAAPHVVKRYNAELGPVIGLDGGKEVFIASAGTPFSFVHLPDRQSVDVAVNGVGLDVFLRAENSVGLYLFCTEPPGVIYARMLASEAGMAEDPATGSAASALAAVLRTQELPAGDYIIHQGVKMGRPSQIHLTLKSDGGCLVGGFAVPIMEGKLRAR